MRTYIRRFFLAMLLVGGLCMAGSEGPFFPFPNVAGGILLVVFALLAGRCWNEEL